MRVVLNFFLLLYLINLSINQGLNYTLACENIYIASEKDCSVAPWYDNYRCCFINYNENGEKKGECVYVEDSEDKLEDKIREYNRMGKSKVKIECNSNNIINNMKFVAIIFFVIYFI